MNEIIIKNQQQLPSTPMPLADLTQQLMSDSERISQAKSYFVELIKERNAEKMKDALVEFDDFVATEVSAIKRNLEQAISKPATRDDIVVAVAVMIHSFPNVKENFDSTIYSQQLIRFLEEWHVSEGVLGYGFRYLIINSKWLPTISEVSNAMNEARRFLSDNLDRIDGNLTKAIPSFDAHRSALVYQINQSAKSTGWSFV